MDGVRASPYVRRVVDDELDALTAGGASAICLEGAKAVGKTATAIERSDETFLLDDPIRRQLLEADPEQILRPARVLVDEWQHVPATWDVVRRAVDRGGGAGQFLLTGSATSNPGTHTGAGRILRVRMRPMTLVERGIGSPTISLARLLDGTQADIVGQTDVDLATYVDEVCRSGFPAVRALEPRVRRAQLQGYVDRVLDREIPDLMGRARRNPGALRRWLAAYGAATSTTASYETIRDAATGGEGNKPAKTTTGPYRDALEALWILDPVPAWTPSRNHIARLGAAPRHHLVDPALVATMLGLEPSALLTGDDGGSTIPRNGPMLGSLFESLVTLSLRVFAQAAEATVGHLRTHRGEREVDCIIERRDHRVVAIEIKLSAVVTDDDVRHLHWLRQTIGDDLIDAAVITTGPDAYRRSDGIAVIPAALLGP